MTEPFGPLRRPNPDQLRQERMFQREMRQRHLVPLYVSWTKDVPHPEAQAALLGVQDTLKAAGQDRQLVVLGSNQWSNGDYGSADWYVQKAMETQDLQRNAGFGQQVDASEIGNLFYTEPWQQTPHWEVFILNHDLNTKDITGKYINFIFGQTNPNFAASIQSITRLMHEVKEPQIRQAMIRRLLRHEVGHMFGLVERDFNTELKLGNHCTNVCTMRQGMSIPEWRQQTLEEDRRGIHFCRDCQHELDQRRNTYKPLPQFIKKD